MVIKKSAGHYHNFAEIIVDYEKKKVKIINAETIRSLRDKRVFDFEPTPFSFFIITLISITVWILILHSEDLIQLGFIMLIFYALSVLLTPLKRKLQLHKLFQHILNDWFSQKKFITIKPGEIKNKMYQLQYRFENRKLDYKLFDDFAKQIIKVHIRPKPYFYKGLGKKLVQQIEEWDCIFYFRHKPKDGKLEITWI